MAEHLMELLSFHSQCTSCEVSVVRSGLCLVSLIVPFHKSNLINVTAAWFYIRLVATQMSQYEVVAFETKDGARQGQGA